VTTSINSQEARPPIQSGERAPDFAVPAVREDRLISLADYRGATPLLLGLFRGLYCPFCRRAIASMAMTSEHLKALGVQCLGIVGTELENARLYFQFRPTPLPLAADPQLTTHRSYGVPKPEPTSAMFEAVAATRINPTGELPEPLPVPAAGEALNAKDRFQPTATDLREGQVDFTQVNGQFLIDRDGIVRWANIEGGKDGFSGLGKFPSKGELLDAARIVID
jgi:peroxiredoxin